jgi:hypothetical protein
MQHAEQLENSELQSLSKAVAFPPQDFQVGGHEINAMRSAPSNVMDSFPSANNVFAGNLDDLRKH